MQPSLSRHDTLLMKAKEMLEKAQFRAVVIGNRRGRTPDIVGLKDGRLYQVEVESEKRSRRNLLRRVDRQYDFAMFFTKGSGEGNMRVIETIETANLPPEPRSEAIQPKPSQVAKHHELTEQHRIRMNETELAHISKGLTLLKGAKIEGLDEKLVDALVERFRRSRPGGRSYRGES